MQYCQSQYEVKYVAACEQPMRTQTERYCQPKQSADREGLLAPLAGKAGLTPTIRTAAGARRARSTRRQRISSAA